MKQTLHTITLLSFFTLIIACGKTKESDSQEPEVLLEDLAFHEVNTILYQDVKNRRGIEPLWVYKKEGDVNANISHVGEFGNESSLYVFGNTSEKGGRYQNYIILNKDGKHIAGEGVGRQNNSFTQRNTYLAAKDTSTFDLYTIITTDRWTSYSTPYIWLAVVSDQLKYVFVKKNIQSNGDKSHTEIGMREVIGAYAERKNLGFVGDPNLTKVGDMLVYYTTANTAERSMSVIYTNSDQLDRSPIEYSPFIAILDDSLNLYAIKVFEDYPITSVDRIKEGRKGHFILEGIETKTEDGTSYLRNIRLEVNRELEIVRDLSDEEPYTFYNVDPYALAYSEEDWETGTSDEYEYDEPEVVEERFLDRTLYEDTKEGVHYRLKKERYVHDNLILEKVKSPDNSVIWARHILLDEYRQMNSLHLASACMSPQGDLVLYIQLRISNFPSRENEAVVFIFNQLGNLSKTYHTDNYYTLRYLDMEIHKNKLLLMHSFAETKLSRRSRNRQGVAIVALPL